MKLSDYFGNPDTGIFVMRGSLSGYSVKLSTHCDDALSIIDVCCSPRRAWQLIRSFQRALARYGDHSFQWTRPTRNYTTHQELSR